MAVDWERDKIPAWQWVNAPNREGDTALHVAAAKGFLFAVTKLLQDGLVDADIVNMMGTYAIIYLFIFIYLLLFVFRLLFVYLFYQFISYFVCFFENKINNCGIRRANGAAPCVQVGSHGRVRDPAGCRRHPRSRRRQGTAHAQHMTHASRHTHDTRDSYARA